MGENPLNEVSEVIGSDALKDITNVLKSATSDSSEEIMSTGSEETGTEFRVASTNLPEKTSMWTKVKNALFYEIKVELTPRQQKIEDEINEFLHQEVTWQSFKNFLFKEVAITYKGKRIF